MVEANDYNEFDQLLRTELRLRKPALQLTELAAREIRPIAYLVHLTVLK